MDTKLLKKLEALFKEEGFTDFKTRSTQRSFSCTAAKGGLSAFFQLTEGQRTKGEPITLAIVPRKASRPAKNVFIPILHVSEEAEPEAPK